MSFERSPNRTPSSKRSQAGAVSTPPKGRPLHRSPDSETVEQPRRAARLRPFRRLLDRPLVYLWALPTTAVGLLVLVLAAIAGGVVRRGDLWHTGARQRGIRQSGVRSSGDRVERASRGGGRRSALRHHVVRGVLEVHGGLVTWFLTRCTLLEGGASAMTLGHVVLGRDAQLLDLTREHERVHVRQCECWGPFFLPAYGLASVIVLLRGGRPYRDNPFEREAYDRTDHPFGRQL